MAERALIFSSLQMFRAVAANAVVVAHLVSIEAKYGHGSLVLPSWLIAAGWSGVHFFFVISGFVMVLASRGRNWREFLGARLLRIYPVYWLYTSLVLAVFLVAPAMVNASHAQTPSILKSYLLWPQAMDPLLAVGWTLIHEMYFYLGLTVLIAFAVPLRIAFPVWALAVVAGWLLIPQGMMTPLLALIFSPLTLEFLLGAAAGLLVRGGFTAGARMMLSLGVVLCAGGMAAFVTGGYGMDDVEASILLLGLPFVVIAYGAAAVERRHGWPRLPLLETLGDASYSTYLGHVLVLSVMGRIYAALPLHAGAGYGPLATGFFLMLCLIAANAAGLVSYRLFEQPILRLRRRFWAGPPAFPPR